MGGVLAIVGLNPGGQTRWRSFDAAILDVKLPQISGLKVLERIKAHDETIQVLILAGAEKERFETALAALRMGAHDFLMKPMRNIQDLLASVDRAVEKRRLAYNLKQLAHGLEQMSNTDTLTGLSNRRHFFAFRHRRYRRLPHENLHFRRGSDWAGDESAGASSAGGRKQRSPGGE